MNTQQANRQTDKKTDKQTEKENGPVEGGALEMTTNADSDRIGPDQIGGKSAENPPLPPELLMRNCPFAQITLILTINLDANASRAAASFRRAHPAHPR